MVALCPSWQLWCPAIPEYTYPDRTPLFHMDALSSMHRILSTILTERILQPLGTLTQRLCPGSLWALSISLRDALSSVLVPENGSFPPREQDRASR
jgi:hypothetical protein